jgi:membrane peptidoglycan carboxypeptidase
VATLGERQPGSSFKPFVYATAFKNGYDDKTIIVDEPTDFGVWGGEHYTPQNYDGLFRGPITIRQALAQSINVPAVKALAYLAGLEDSIKTAQEMGITTLTQPSSFYGLSLVLGGGEVKLLDMVSAYGVFANNGLRVPAKAILIIEDSNGNVIEEFRNEPKRVLESGIVQMISDILSDNNARAGMFGLNSPLYFNRYKVSVKTGTTSSYKDGWIIGYTPSIAIGMWSGNNNNQPARKDPAVVSVAPMWHQVMQYYLDQHPDQSSMYLEPSPIPEATVPISQ